MRTVTLSLLALLSLPGCGGGRYGFARAYEAYGPEGTYLSREVDLSYQEVRRFPERHANDLVGWFGVVREIQQLDRQSGEARLLLDLRVHQDRHLCSDETAGSCRVTVSERGIGPFTALVRIEPQDLATGPERLWTGSLVKIYGHVMDAGTEESGPVLQAEWYRQWPHGFYVTTGARGAMRR